ncbi:MAG: hypothetical protein NVS9B10_10710 [Nevskia sp.]
MPLTSGAQLEGYVIQRLLGRGRYGFRYLAQDASKRECLIREFLPHEFAERSDGAIRPRDAEDRTALRFWMRSFLEKSTQVSHLVHPALPQVLRQFEAHGTGYEVCSYEPGESLQTLLDTGGTLSEAALLRVLRGLCGALETAHAAGLMHHDLCLEHVWLRDSDGTVCLQEFGIMRAPIRMKARAVTGIPAAPFAAPEDDAASHTPTAAADLYALGVIAYRALSGTLPPSAAERRRGVVVPPLAAAARGRCSAELLAAIEQAMQMAPEQRPRSVAEWRASLRAAAADAPAARADRPRVASRRPLRFALPAAALVAVAAIGYLLVPKSGVVPAAAAVQTALPAPASGSAATASPAAPAAATTAAETSLDRLALELIARERKLQEARDAQRVQEEREKAQAAAKLKETETRTAGGAAPAIVNSAPPAPSPAAVEAEARTRTLEAEVARLRADSEARQRSEEEAAKARAQAAAEKDLAAQGAEAERARQTQAIALARKKCSLPAMDLSEGGNLNFYNALQAPGARKTAGGAIRLPPVELGNGKTAIYEITPDSCAHLVR